MLPSAAYVLSVGPRCLSSIFIVWWYLSSEEPLAVIPNSWCTLFLWVPQCCIWLEPSCELCFKKH